MRTSRRVPSSNPWSRLASLLAAALFALLGPGCADAGQRGGNGGESATGAEAALDEHAGHDHGDEAGDDGDEHAGGSHAGHDHGEGEHDDDGSDADAAATGDGGEQETAGGAAGGGAALDPALSAIDAFIAGAGIDKTDSGWKTKLPRPEMVAFTPERTYFWHMNTNVGPIKIRLMPDVAPMHCTSTIYLTRLGFYDDVVFHRVITRFMAQGGDPTGTGRGGPGYKYAGEFDPSVKHDRPGLLSMANAGPGTDGSQFFLTFVPTDWLDGKHTIFGEVVEGMETVQALEKQGSQSGRPRADLRIETATISVE